MKLKKDTARTLREIAQQKNITNEDATNMVLNIYSKQYLKMIQDAKKAAENARKLYNN